MPFRLVPAAPRHPSCRASGIHAVLLPPHPTHCFRSPSLFQRLRIVELTLDHEAPYFSNMRQRNSRKDSDLTGVVDIRCEGGRPKLGAESEYGVRARMKQLCILLGRLLGLWHQVLPPSGVVAVLLYFAVVPLKGTLAACACCTRSKWQAPFLAHVRRCCLW